MGQSWRKSAFHQRKNSVYSIFSEIRKTWTWALNGQWGLNCDYAEELRKMEFQFKTGILRQERLWAADAAPVFQRRWLLVCSMVLGQPSLSVLLICKMKCQFWYFQTLLTWNNFPFCIFFASFVKLLLSLVGLWRLGEDCDSFLPTKEFFFSHCGLGENRCELHCGWVFPNPQLGDFSQRTKGW